MIQIGWTENGSPIWVEGDDPVVPPSYGKNYLAETPFGPIPGGYLHLTGTNLLNRAFAGVGGARGAATGDEGTMTAKSRVLEKMKNLTESEKSGLCSTYLNPSNDIYAPGPGFSESPVMKPKEVGYVHEVGMAIYTKDGQRVVTSPVNGRGALPVPGGAWERLNADGELEKVSYLTVAIEVPTGASEILRFHSHPRHPDGRPQPPSGQDRAPFDPSIAYGAVYRNSGDYSGSGVFDGNTRQFYWMDRTSPDYEPVSFDELATTIDCAKYLK